MVFRSIAPSPRGTLSPQQTLKLANVYLENASNADDTDIALVLCHDTIVSLSQAKKAVKRTEDPTVIQAIAVAYINLSALLDNQGHTDEAKAIYKKAEKLGVNVKDMKQHSNSSRPGSATQSLRGVSHAVSQVSTPARSSRQQRYDIATIPVDIFPQDVPPPSVEFTFPETDGRLDNTPQLVSCLYILKTDPLSDEILDPVAHTWRKTIDKDVDEQDRLRTMATEVIRAFKRDVIKDTKVVAEVVYLAPVLSRDAFQDLLSEFYSGINHSGLLKFHQLEGLAQLVQGAEQGHLSADDLVKILGLLSNRLRDTHQQSSLHMYQLTLAVSHVLDAMADTKVTGLDREKLHEPLSTYLKELRESKDPFLVYQAAYAYQALLCVPDNETTWQAALRRTGKVVFGFSGIAKAVKELDLAKFIESLESIHQGVTGSAGIVHIVATAYTGVKSLSESGQSLLDCLKESFSTKGKRTWYSALQGADTLIRNGELASFRTLMCEAPCRLDPAFQWGVCQRLGEIAGNLMWDADTRKGSITFLGEIYRNDEVWGQHANVKQWIVNILMQLALSPETDSQWVETLLRELETSGDDKKQALYRSCREKGPIVYPLKISQPELATPSLLDRVQNRPDVEGRIRLLRKQRTKERGNAVYIPPQAKASLQADDSTRFPLMEKVKEFLGSDQKVLLVIGDSGAGKTTFNRELESELWQSYKSGTGRIPLHINLPAIDKPEHDMIDKQLRRAEFTEPQIQELKHYRKFILICDGYDESLQTHNLYTSNRLNESEEWDVQMVISCRTEYLGNDYRDRFQPGNRNQQSDSHLFQEAVITPFSIDQVHSYIQQYVVLYQPLWQVEDYKRALELIPSLKDLVKNPFLMALSLEVLPRMVDPSQRLSEARVTRVGLYDHFVEQWLERGKKRIGEKELSPQSRAVFEKLSAEGFTVNGIAYLKKLAVAIYKEQDGHPVIQYSRLVDEGSWKDAFFSRDDRQLLYEACPITRSGNQHRFIHRSLLEYALSRAIFDPHDEKNTYVSTPDPVKFRRGSVSSTMSFELEDTSEDVGLTPEHEPDFNSPLVWRSFVSDHSLMHFLEERVQQEPAFKSQLLAYIEYSKKDEKWRKAASNAITILVRAGVQFIGADLNDIRVPGADLSYGVFDSAQLQNADLRKANLRGVWLRQTDISGAQMRGVQFGELPFLTEDIEIRSCAYSPDGKSIAVGFFDGKINVYSTSNWERTRTLSGHSGVVVRLVYSPTGGKIASASLDKTVRLWDIGTGSQLHVLEDHTDQVFGVAYSPQGDVIASAGGDMTVRLWDVITGNCRKILPGHTREVVGVAYSPNRHQVASCSADLTIRLWNVDTGECIRILFGHSDIVWDAVYSPDGDQLASASKDKTVHLWNVETGASLHVLYGHTNTVYSVTYSPKGDQVVSGSVDSTVRIWDVETGSCRHTLTGHRDSVFIVAYSPKGDKVASGSVDKTLRLWDVSASSSSLVSSGHSAAVTGIKCSPKGDTIVSGSTDNTIRLWDAETGACRRILSGHTSTVMCVAYSPNEDRIASGSADKVIRVWKVDSGECQHIMIGHTDWILGIAFSPKGDVVASASHDKTVRLWNVVTEDCKVLSGHAKGVNIVVFSSDGKQIVTGSQDRTVRFWDIDTGECCKILIGHASWVTQVMYSPQGDQLASSSADKTVRLWDVQTGECRLTLTGHTNPVLGVTYSADGKLLASGSMDKTVRLWNVSSGDCRAVVENFPDDVNCVAWCASSDGNNFLTGCFDGSILKWQVSEKEDQCRVQLQWSAANGALTATGALIQDAHGLTALNRQLLNQRGAISELGHPFQKASKKAITSVVSKLNEMSIRFANSICR